MSTAKPTTKVIQLPPTRKETELHKALGLNSKPQAKDVFVRGEAAKAREAQLAHLVGNTNVESKQQEKNRDRLAQAFGDIGSELGIASLEEAGIPKEWLS